MTKETFGEYIRHLGEGRNLALRKMATALIIDIAVLSKTERNNRVATKKMISIIAKILDRPEKEIKIEFIQSFIESNLGNLKYLKDRLKKY